MESVGKAIYQAMRDDTTLRALLGNPAANPYNIFHAEVPQGFDFSPASGTKRCITYFEVSSVPDQEFAGSPCQAVAELYNVTAYGRIKTDVEAIQKRVKWILQDKRLVTQPTSEAVILNIKRENKEGARWDEAWQCYFMTAIYRVWAKDEEFS